MRQSRSPSGSMSRVLALFSRRCFASPWVVLHLPVLDAKTVTNEISALKRLKVAGFHFVLVANHFSMSGVGLT